MFKKQFVSFILLLMLGIGISLGFRIWQVKSIPTPTFIPKKTTFKLQPPQKALTGEILESTGEVKKESRDKEKPEIVRKKDKVLTGEKITTNENSSAIIEFKSFGKVTVNEDSETGFISLIPSSFLLTLNKGSVIFESLDNNNPISVRSFPILFSLDTGKSKISINKNNNIVINLLAGRAKFAMNNLENETHVWNLEKGQEALINKDLRTVEITNF